MTQFASAPLGLLGPPPAPPAPRAPGFKTFDEYVDAFHQQRGSGSEFGGGAYGTANRDVEMMDRGGAPFTADALAAGVGNAFSTVTGFGMRNPLQMGIRAAKAAIMGEPLAQGAFGVRDIPGHFAYDPDLVDAVGRRAMSRAAAHQEQVARNTKKQSLAFAHSMNSVDAGRHGGGLLGGRSPGGAPQGGMHPGGHGEY